LATLINPRADSQFQRAFVQCETQRMPAGLPVVGDKMRVATQGEFVQNPSLRVAVISRRQTAAVAR
jgi:hypothetical protein